MTARLTDADLARIEEGLEEEPDNEIVELLREVRAIRSEHAAVRDRWAADVRRFARARFALFAVAAYARETRDRLLRMQAVLIEVKCFDVGYAGYVWTRHDDTPGRRIRGVGERMLRAVSRLRAVRAGETTSKEKPC